MQMCNYTCRPASATDDVKKLAQYIHLTDPYIYPLLCEDPLDPRWVAFISACMQTRGHVFHMDHLQVVLCGEEIVGIACVIPCGKQLNFSAAVNTGDIPRDSLESVCSGYFAPLIEESLGYDGFNIINVCVDENHRRKGVGKLLLSHCISLYGHLPVHLDVIASNRSAVRLYRNVGFRIVDTYSGFSGTDQELPCYHMLYAPMPVS